MGLYEKAVALWRSWQVRSVADIDLRLDSFRVLFAYHSGKIENPEVTYHDTREIFENGRVGGQLHRQPPDHLRAAKPEAVL